MRVVITGALGYIGSRLIRSAWPDSVDELVLVDNLSVQGPATMFELVCNAPVRFIEGDIRTFDIAGLIEPGDVVVHLAAITGSAPADRVLLEEVNVTGAVRVAHACAERGARFLMPSSTSVYGGFDGEVDETFDIETCRPSNSYAESKWRAEKQIARVVASRPLRYAIVRFGTVYGPSPGLRDHTAISKFCWQAAIGHPLSVWRTAIDQRRPYLDIGDAVRAIHFLIARDRFDGDTFDVVTETATVRDAIAILREIVPDLLVEYVDSAVMTSRSQDVAARRIRAEGLVFAGSLRGGIAGTMEAFAGLRQRGRHRDRH